MRKISWAFLLTAILCPGFFAVEASEIFSSADVMEGGSWALSAYGRSADTEPEVRLSGTDAIQVPTSGGSSTVFANSNADVEMEQRAEEIIMSAAFRPREGLTYKLKVGQVSDYELEFASGSQTNKLESTKQGLVWGLGLSGSIAPGSIVSTAISWSLDFTQRFVDLDRLQGGSIVYAADQKIRQEEYQAAVNFSHRWKKIEPYAGLKLMRIATRLTDGVTKQKISGDKDGVSPFVGLKWDIADRESFVIEGSFIEEESLTAGIKVQF